MATRIATQLAAEIKATVGPDTARFRTVTRETLARWHRWATRLDARMRLDGSEKNKRKVKK